MLQDAVLRTGKNVAVIANTTILLKCAVLENGDTVYSHLERTWKPARVIKHFVALSSYMGEAEEEDVYGRNRGDLMKTDRPVQERNEEEEQIEPVSTAQSEKQEISDESTVRVESQMDNSSIKEKRDTNASFTASGSRVIRTPARCRETNCLILGDSNLSEKGRCNNSRSFGVGAKISSVCFVEDWRRLEGNGEQIESHGDEGSHLCMRKSL